MKASGCRLRIAVSVVIVTLVVLPARAGVIVWDEALQGDIPQDFADGMIFSLVGGDENFVVGSETISLGAADYDNFGFIVPLGYELTSLVYEYSLSSVVGVDNIDLFAQVFGEPTGNAVDEIGAWPVWQRIYYGGVGPALSPINLPLYVTDAGNPTQVPTGPLASGDYWLAMGRGWSGSGDATWNYRWTFSLSSAPVSVPEPGTLGLLGAGLLGVLVRRRRNAAV
jgi:hypothetical protein